MPPLSILAAMALSLASIEGLAWWWMNPRSTGPAQPVLSYRPKVGLDRRAGPLAPAERSEDGLVANAAQGQGTAEADGALGSPSSNQPSTINNRQSAIPHLPSLTPLPEIYDKAAPMLRCSSGQVCHFQLDESIGLHLAFFEWDGTDTGSVLEAFRHMPEACMGSIGMQLVEKAPPRSYVVRGQETVGLDRRAGRDSANGAESASSNSKLKIQNSKFATQSLTFDHTIFREPGTRTGGFAPGPLVHAFRAVWVAGLTSADARQGLDGNEFNRLRAIRLKSALTRFRPAHARVIQGAVRGASNGTAAWNAFQSAMLNDLTMETR